MDDTMLQTPHPYSNCKTYKYNQSLPPSTSFILKWVSAMHGKTMNNLNIQGETPKVTVI
jgi:hypothetical protein